MSEKKTYGALVALLLFACIASAQSFEASESVQLTHSVQGTVNIYPYPVWNGAEWGVVYMRLYGEITVNILRCTADGYLIEGHELFGKDKNYGFTTPGLCSYENGWAMTVTNRRYSEQIEDRTAYFLLLNKKARKTGVQTTLFSHQRGQVYQPIAVGSMFVVFYRGVTSNGFEGIKIAYIDRKGKRVIPDVTVTNPAGEHHLPLYVTPTSEGFAIVGLTSNHEEYRTLNSAFFILVGLDGSQLTALTKINNNGTGIRPRAPLWNGNSFALAATENLGFDDQNYAPITRMLKPDGTWQGGAVRHLQQAFNAHFGLGFDGNHYAAIIANMVNGTVWCQELNSNLRPSGPKVMTEDSWIADYSSTAACAGSMTGFFGVIMKALGGDTGNIYYTRIQQEHQGKPDIAYFNGKIHEFNGKQYVLLDWCVAGCESIKMKTKGGRWTLSPSGFHAVEITKKSRYKIVAANGSGSAKAKLKITP